MTKASAEHREVSDDEVDAYILSWAETGVRKESGTFTIARDRAWSQLSRLQLPFEEAWVLKLVQSAVVGKAARLDVRQSRQETTFVFEGVTHWICPQVEDSIFALEGVSSPDLGHLSLALQTDLSTLRLRPDEALGRRRLAALGAVIAGLKSHPMEFTCDTAPPLRFSWWNGIALTVYWIVNVSLGFSLTITKTLIQIMSGTAGRDALLAQLKEDQEKLIAGLRSHLKLLEKS